MTERPLPAVELGEVLATSDVPGGVVNLLTGRVAELGPWLAAHSDVDGLDLAGAPQTWPSSWSGRRPSPSSACCPPERQASWPGCGPGRNSRPCGTRWAADL